MKFKILFIMAVLLISGYTASSQSKGISFGLRGGVNFQNINGTDMNGDKLELDMVPRFNVGAVVDIPVAPDFYFETGLLYTTKGAKAKDDFLGLNMSAEYNLSYLELPLNFLYKPLLGKGHLLLGFGPYVAYGLGGNSEYVINNVTSEQKIVYSNEFASANPYDQEFKHLDYGGNLFFGYQLSNGISLQLNTQLGMAKINAKNTTYPNSETSFKNTGFGFSLGYNF
ncbi:MAG TPA: PorT family protein [Prolixibacteraceae bacterium]|nr:PorT family protein [Prolixibacteraceae bacterium]